MKLRTLLLGLFGLAVAGFGRAVTLKLTRTIPLPGVEGRIDHFALDEGGQRLFVAALGNNSVEVVDLKTGRVLHSLRDLAEPQGVVFVPGFNRLYVANGGDGTLRVYDGTTFTPVTVIQFADDADNVRYDPAARQVYVGYGGGALGVVDAAKNTVVGDIALSAHPESFQLEQNGPRIFVNVPGSHAVTVVDRNARKAAGTWSLGLVAANFPMALDEAGHRAFVACRVPARLLVFDTESGREVARLGLHGDCDDVFYDAKRRRIYASCGEGFLDVFFQVDADHYALESAVKTSAKARTCLFRESLIYLAVPQSGNHPAEIRCYEVSD